MSSARSKGVRRCRAMEDPMVYSRYDCPNTPGPRGKVNGLVTATTVSTSKPAQSSPSGGASPACGQPSLANSTGSGEGELGKLFLGAKLPQPRQLHCSPSTQPPLTVHRPPQLRKLGQETKIDLTLCE